MDSFGFGGFLRKQNRTNLTTLVIFFRAMNAASVRRRNPEFMKLMFDKYKDAHKNLVTRSDLKKSFLDCQISELDGIEHILAEISNLNEEDEIGYEEYCRILSIPSMLEQWTQGIPLWQLLADSIPRKFGVFIYPSSMYLILWSITFFSG